MSIEEYKPEHIEWLREYRPEHSLSETHKEFNKVWGTEYTISQIKHRLYKFRIGGKDDGKFKKGHASWNKGMNMRVDAPEIYNRICVATVRSNKNRNPATMLPLGTETYTRDGYMVKTGMPDIWERRARVNYERANNVKLKPKDRVLHLDGDRFNDNPENLYIVDDAILARLNKIGLITPNGELTRVAVAQQMLLRAIREKQNA